MNRVRARFLALVALAVLAPGAGAATIEVTTFDDVVADDDGLCSIREALTASVRASALSARNNSRNQIVTNQELLEENLPRLEAKPGLESFPRETILSTLSLMIGDLEAHTPESGSAQDLARDALLDGDGSVDDPTLPGIDGLVDYRDNYIELLTGDVFLDDVNRVLGYIESTLALIDEETVRLEDLNEIDGCDNGSAFDVVLLEDGTYTVDSELVVEGRIAIQGKGETTILRPEAAPTRLLRVEKDVALDISKLVLEDGNAGGGNGGAIHADGPLKISDVVFTGHQAANGGAIFLDDEGSAEISGSVFVSNVASADGGAIAMIGARLVVTDTIFGRESALDPDRNQAGGDGGAIHALPVAEAGSVSLSRVAIVNNLANSGAGVWIGGDGVSLLVDSTTLAHNEARDAAVIDVATTGNGTVEINNATVVFNDVVAGGVGPDGTGGIRIAVLSRVEINNTLLAGNAGVSGAGWDVDCDFSGVVALLTPSELIAFTGGFNRNYYDSGSVCPGDRVLASPSYTNYELPLGETVASYLLQTPINEDGYFVPVFPDDANNPAENRLVNRGASSQEPFLCAAKDQRNLDRNTFIDADCDIGAAEYQIGRRVDDYVETRVNEPTCIDVVANDIGDADYVPYSLIVYAVERRGAVAAIAIDNPGDPLNPLSNAAAYLTAFQAFSTANPALDLPEPQIVDLAECPQNTDSDPDNDITRDAILMTPASGFQGETNVTYGLAWTTATATPVGGEVSGIARVFTESRGGIRSSSIDLAAGGPWSLALLALLALRRRCLAAGRLASVALAAGLLLLAGPARAAEDNIIYVTTGDDPLPGGIPGDGLCTLREALAVARNDTANLTDGDCLDGNEGPDVIEFAPGVTEVILQGPLQSGGGVTIRCPEPAEDDPDPQTCTISRAPASPAFRLLESTGGIAIVRMRFEGGDAGDSDGGAIYSAAGITIEDSIFRGNRARTGGAIFLGGPRGDLNIYDSIFTDNESTGTGLNGGGVVAMSNAQHKVQITGSTFYGNRSDAQAAVLSLKTSRSVVVVNSTFSGNVSERGSGAIDTSGVLFGATLRNLTVIGNRSGIDDLPVVPVQRAAIEGATGSGQTVLGSSVVAANRDFANTLYANCENGAFNTAFNVFGQLASPACQGDPTDQVLSDTLVYDGDDDFSDLTGYLAPLPPEPLEGYDTPPFHYFTDPAAVGGILIDAGYDTNLLDSDPELASRFDIGTPACATEDQRGASRESGGRCDIGSVEYVQTTAVADANDNIGRPDRLVVVDFLDNDIVDGNNLCVATQTQYLSGISRLLDAGGDTCAEVTYDPLLGTVTFLRVVDDPDEDDPEFKVFRDDAGDPVEGRTTTDSEWVLLFDNDGVLVFEESAVELQYRIFGDNGDASAPVPIVVSVLNVPPDADDDSVYAAVGATVVIDVLANDEDTDGSNLDPSSVRIVGSGCEEEVEGFQWRCQFGTATVDALTGRITWTPFNTFSPFTESFQYEVQDMDSVDDSAKGTATVTIRMSRPEANGGAILGDDDISDMLGLDFLGATGGWFLAPLLLALARRRRR